MKPNYTSIDAFCGAGGLTIGLERAGFRTVAAFDADPAAVNTFKQNISDNVLGAKVEELTGVALLNYAKIDRRLDLFAGGPPCQGFSKQKRGAHLGDKRNYLVLEFARLVREIVPRFFLLENVAQLGGVRGKHFVETIHQELRDYDLFPHFYNSADYWVAQTRVRFVIVGKHRDVAAPFSVPEPMTSKWLTVGEVLEGLPEPPDDYSEHPDYPNHYRAKVTNINIERFSHVPQGGGWWDIPEYLRLPCHKDVDRSSGGWPDVYGRLRADGQATTITGGFDSFTRGRYGHPYQDRPLTPREAARLQGFPDSFRFYGDRYQIRHQIGNAVPSPLAEAIGKALVRTLMIEAGLIDAGEADRKKVLYARQFSLSFGR